MYPVPRHLTEIFETDPDKTDEYNLEGALRCSCGCRQFQIKTYSEIGEDGCPGVAGYSDGYSFVIKGICRSCKKEWLIFDMSKHGYNGFVCHEDFNLEPPDTELKMYYCPKCSKNAFEMRLGIELEDKEQFMEEVVEEEPDQYTEDDYVDAFDWITISATCSCCGEVYDNWVSLETS